MIHQVKSKGFLFEESVAIFAWANEKCEISSIRKLILKTRILQISKKSDNRIQ